MFRTLNILEKDKEKKKTSLYIYIIKHDKLCLFYITYISQWNF